MSRDIDIVRKWLNGYDDGLLTESEMVHRLLTDLLMPMVERAEEGYDTGMGSAYCGGEPPPEKRAIIEVGISRLWFYPIDSAARYDR